MAKTQRVKVSVLTAREVQIFQKKIYDHFEKYGRDFAWRRTRNPYRILVSEIMLQQTQTARVEKKFPEFLHAFSDFHTLARAPLARVLTVWQGMGYNRRAVALKKTAEIVMKKYHGRLPRTVAELDALPGIGMHTAGSIRAFAFNLPAVFIETNIRTVFIHEFFSDTLRVHDRVLLLLIEQTLDRVHPRRWYWALMDYGVMLKKKFKNPSRRSAQYHAQSKFEGSHRQVRGMILKVLIAEKRASFATLSQKIPAPSARIRTALKELEHEHFLCKKGGVYMVSQAKFL